MSSQHSSLTNGVHRYAADPAGMFAGHVYFNTVTKKLRVYDGSTWADVGGSGGDVPAARVRHSADQSLGGANAFHAVAFNTPDAANTPGMFSLSNPTRLVATQAGLHRITGNLDFSPAAGDFIASIFLNGATEIARGLASNATGADGSAVLVTVSYRLTVGQYVELWEYHTNGAGTIRAFNYSPVFTIEWVRS